MSVVAPKVYAAINAVADALSKVGIGKNQTNQAQRFKFRGIDDVLAGLSRPLVDHGVRIFPRVVARESVERETKNGGAITATTLTVEYDFVAVEDGSKHTATVIGEAMDTGDKSHSKALSIAFKTVCFQVFCIPLDGEEDPDASSHELASNKQPPTRATVLVGGNQNSKAAAKADDTVLTGRTSASTGTAAAEESASRKLLRGELAKHGEAEEAVTNKLLDAIGFDGVEDIPEDQLPAALTKLLAYNQKLKAAAKARQDAAAGTPPVDQPATGKPAGRQRKAASDLPV